MGSVTQGSVRSDGAGRTRMWCSRSHPSLPPSPPAPPCLPLSLPKRPLPSLCSPSPPAAHRPCSPSPMPPSFLQTHPSSSLPDLCFSASLKRSHFEYRRALLASSLPELTHSLQ